MRKLSIMIMALNEEEHIEATVAEIMPIARQVLDEFEFILIDDGSRDRTGNIMDDLARQYPEIRVIHHPENRGMSANIQDGLDQARFPFLAVFPGDNTYNGQSLKPFFEAVGEVDFVFGNRVNMFQSRTLFRARLSRLFTMTMNILFRFRLQDVNGPYIYPVQAIREMKLEKSQSFLHLAIMVPVFRRGASYKEVPVLLRIGANKSRILRFQTVMDLSQIVWRLLFNKSLRRQQK